MNYFVFVFILLAITSVQNELTNDDFNNYKLEIKSNQSNNNLTNIQIGKITILVFFHKLWHI
jgi:hypothetical protein